MQAKSVPKAVGTLSNYLKLKSDKEGLRREFWNKDRISHIRQLASAGKAVIPGLNTRLVQQDGFVSEIQDRLLFVPADPAVPKSVPVGTSVTLVDNNENLWLSIPIVWGDMSFGAIHANAQLALAEAAERTKILCGTGEGGLHKEVRKYKRFNVQWASARFGVDIDVLNCGSMIVIKIGQGAKPGIGGHLPGAKVIGDIPSTRRIPEGRDAISPAPHHDIYSIEDLGQRIWGLKEATGKPVFVKVAATNYVPYVACGIARMGADGIVIDGHLAGTGASPEVVRDNIGIPIELAVAASDKMLRQQMMDGKPLRNRVSIIAGGGVASAETAAKLLALGADAAMMGTAALVAIGCVMVHRCHTGKCPTALATQSPIRYLSVEWATQLLVNFVNGMKEEFEIILRGIGLSRMTDLIGNRDVLVGMDMNHETLGILGIKSQPKTESEPSLERIEIISQKSEVKEVEELWPYWKQEHIQQIAKTGEVVITSMGALGPPFVQRPQNVCDWLRSDGAQVTRPSIDSYREEIESCAYLAKGEIRLSLPVIFNITSEKAVTSDNYLALIKGANSLNTLLSAKLDHVKNSGINDKEKLRRYVKRMLIGFDFKKGKDANDLELLKASAGVLLAYQPKTDIDEFSEVVSKLRRDIGQKPIFVRVPSLNSMYTKLVNIAESGTDGIIVDAGSIADSLADRFNGDESLPIEFSISMFDRMLRNERSNGVALRRKLNLIAQYDGVRGAEDIFKLIALGADAVTMSDALLIAMQNENGSYAGVDSDIALNRLENFVWGMQKEIKLLMGAAGISAVSTLISSRELLRSVDLDPSIRQIIGVKPAGA